MNTVYICQRLRARLGLGFTAILADADSGEEVDRWAEGATSPDAGQQRRLEAGLRVLGLISEAKGPEQAAAWLAAGEGLSGSTPAAALGADRFEEVEQELEAFLTKPQALISRSEQLDRLLELVRREMKARPRRGFIAIVLDLLRALRLEPGDFRMDDRAVIELLGRKTLPDPRALFASWYRGADVDEKVFFVAAAEHRQALRLGESIARENEVLETLHRLLELGHSSGKTSAYVLQWMTIPSTYWGENGGYPIDHLYDREALLRVARESWNVEW
jgi:hypothetical protein